MIYPQRNDITSSPETPYLQIGESKYGKPSLDRIVHLGLSLNQGARLALVSLDATARSNITVGPPFELVTYQRGSLRIGVRCRFDANDKYLTSLCQAWNTGLKLILHNRDFRAGATDRFRILRLHEGDNTVSRAYG